jgi:protein-tyrosine phosphatase
MGFFNWSAKNKLSPTFDWGIHIDIHNHILPALDDGSSDILTSHILLDGLQELGFSSSISTPHIALGLYHNDLAGIQQSYECLKDSMPKTHQDHDSIDLESDINSAASKSVQTATPKNMLHGFAAEYMLDDQFFHLIEKGLITYPSEAQYVLVEFPYLGKPHQWHEMVFEMHKSGYQPILAHPERYQFITPEYLMQKLMHAGFKFQLNLLSLSGYYGPKIKACADLYLKEGVYQFAGTDMHHSFHLEALRKMKQDEKISAKLLDYTFQNELLF